MTEQEIIHLALENLQKQTQIMSQLITTQKKELDGQVIMHLEGKEFKFNIEIKNELRSHHLQQIEGLNKKYRAFMLVAGRLFPKIKEELRNKNITYLEANGNIYLKNSNYFLWIDVNDPLPVESKNNNRAFTKTGLKVVFLFLLDEKWINKTYRQIAEQTGTTISNINSIINGLKQEGLLIPVNKKQYNLKDKKQLLDKWVAAYDHQLKPTLKIGTFRFLKDEEFIKWKKLPIHPGKTCWGAEPAADILTNYLRPQVLTLYTLEARNELIKNYRLIPDEKGNVTVYEKFWQHGDVKENVAPPLLVYADLVNTNDRRCIEAAQKIYNEFLQDKL